MSFTQEIQSLCEEKNISYIDAIVLLSEQKNLEIEVLADFLKKDPVIVSKLQYEAEELNILKKGARLPI